MPISNDPSGSTPLPPTVNPGMIGATGTLSPEEQLLQDTLTNWEGKKASLAKMLAKAKDELANSKDLSAEEVAQAHKDYDYAVSLGGSVDVGIAALKDAIVKIQNPALTPADKSALAKFFAQLVKPDFVQTVKRNPFLENLEGVTLSAIMQTIMRDQKNRNFDDSGMWREQMAVLKDMADSMADLIKDKAKDEAEKLKNEAYGQIASGIASIAFAAGSAVASSSQVSTALNAIGSGAGGISQGITSILNTELVIDIGDIDAQKARLEYSQQLARSISDKILEDEKSAADTLDKTNEAFKKLMDSLFSMIKSLTAH